MTVTATRRLRLGTRGSALALAQSDLVAGSVRNTVGRGVELVRIATAGDRSAAPIAMLGGTGVFVSALRDALLAGEIDLAVHSYKDLPTAPADGLVIAAVPTRADTRDALVARSDLVARGAGTLATLPAGARVGTGAPRRIAQLLAARPDLVAVPIRGNVDTRLATVARDELDAVVLAAAGLARLGREDEITELLDPTVVLPAPAQGALAVECRADDTDLVAALAMLDDPVARATVTAERALLATLEAGCSAPVGAHAAAGPVRAGFDLYAAVLAPDGRASLRMSAAGLFPDADAVGRRLAAALLDAGATRLMCPPDTWSTA